MKSAIRAGCALTLPLMFTSCIGVDRDAAIASNVAQKTNAGFSGSTVVDSPVTIGSPFTIDSITYTPVDVGSYDEVGYAASRSIQFSGKPTANGEVLNSSAVNAAHKTLPLPSYVEVTALQTGRTILVRINDRGPLVHDRLLDLSQGAAQQLGISANEAVGVRVRRVNPPEQERAVLRAGLRAAERTETPQSLLRILREKLSKQPSPPQNNASDPKKLTSQSGITAQTASAKEDRFIRENDNGPQPMPVSVDPLTTTTVGTDNRYVVQIAALSLRSSADRLARKLNAKVSVTDDGRLFRVRYGPFASKAEAERILTDARKRGYPQAKAYRN